MRSRPMRGNVYAWVVVLALGWAATLLWIIFTTILVEHVYPWASDQIVDATAQQTLDDQITYWNYWPMLFMGGLTVFAFASSLKREPTDSYYPA